MKKIISIAFLMLMTVMTMAQNQKISYQMVVRNAANEIVPNTSGVEVTISLLDANNGIMYSEKHTLTTDANGLISCFIGDGDLLSGEYNNVVWENASIETKLLVPGETEVSATQKLGFLPHALYAKNLNFQFLEDYLNAHGEKVGLVKVRLYRPFAKEAFVNAIPKTVKTIAVLDRTKEPGALGEPLYLDVVAALKGSKFDAGSALSGRYGLGSKDTTPAQIVAVFNNAEKKMFTIGIEDDVTYLSLDVKENPDTTPAGNTSCMFWGLGSDGTVGANKNSIKIIGEF